ncbi:glycoside hydrolase superfamily, partial [Chytriomyces sp. MP71]
VFAPYIDVGAWPTLDPIAYKTNTGATHFMLAFVTADSSNMPTFAGNPTDGSFFASEIAAIRAQGGDVCISFGGASGTELANVAKDATALANQYLAVLNAYKATCADFDIEGASIAQPASVDLRNQAIAILKKSLPELYLSYTLPVLPTGLDYWGVALIASVAKYGAKVDLINIMAMDYGGPSTQMGTDAINAAVATRTQILAAGLTAKVGVTPMTGVND